MSATHSSAHPPSNTRRRITRCAEACSLVVSSKDVQQGLNCLACGVAIAKQPNSPQGPVLVTIWQLAHAEHRVGVYLATCSKALCISTEDNQHRGHNSCCCGTTGTFTNGTLQCARSTAQRTANNTAQRFPVAAVIQLAGDAAHSTSTH